MPLRRWMMNGMGFYARGVVRDRLRDRMRPFTDVAGGPTAAGVDPAAHGEDDLLGSDDRTAEAAFERAWAMAVLEATHAQAHATLAAEGRLDQYEVFRRRVIDGEGYESIGPSVGMTPQQCANATRLVSQRLAAAMREVLRAEGVREGDLDRTAMDVQRAVADGH
jgi:hypothetical protein